MCMPSGFNRALQVRVANRLRAHLARDERSGLPLMGDLSEGDHRELCEVGGGRLAAIALAFSPEASVAEVVACIRSEVRRTDVLGFLEVGLALLLVPGLDSVGGQSLVSRLSELLAGFEVEIGVAYRSGASTAGWTARALAEEALARGMVRVERVA
jgi:hypothetical protein